MYFRGHALQFSYTETYIGGVHLNAESGITRQVTIMMINF